MKRIFLIYLAFALISCKKDVRNEVEVYNNDFENNNITSVKNGTIVSFNGGKVLGRYNNGSFELNLSNLPKHNLINISFDLNIHDSWEGNQSYGDNLVGPDVWQMIVDGKTYINTTFSNHPCMPGNICASQSYPGSYPSNYNPRTGSVANVPGACINSSDATGTSVYKISKNIQHSSSDLSLICLDHLIDKNVPDPKCSESWSIDNLKITAVVL